MIKVSVIIPVYNAEKYLKKCLDSVMNQTIDNYEVIAINDGSTDDSLNILREYEKKYQVLHIFDQKNAGISKTRNFGINVSKGKYIMFLDSDDYIDRKMLKKLYNKAENDDLDIVVCDYYEVMSNNKTTEITLPDFQNTNIKYNKRLINDINPSPWNKLFNSSFLKSQPFRYPEGLKYEDFGYIPLLILKAKRIGKLSEPLYYYVIREKSQTTTIDNNVFDIFDILNILFKYYSDDNIVMTEEAEYLFLNKITTYNLQQKYNNDKKSRLLFIEQSFKYLDTKFPHWKNNNYFKQQNILKKIIKKSKFFTKLYISIGGKHENKK